MNRKPKRVIVIDGVFAALESGTYDGVEITRISQGTLDQVLEAEKEWRDADLVVVLDGGQAFCLPEFKPEIDRLLHRLGLVDRARLDKLLDVTDFDDPDYEGFPLHYVQRTLAPDYGEHCIKRKDDGTRVWTGSESGETDDPWRAEQRFFEAAARAVSRLFLSGHGTEQQEVWMILSVPNHTDRDHLIEGLLGRRVLKGGSPCDVSEGAASHDPELLALVEGFGLRAGSSLPEGLPQAAGPLGSALGAGAVWRRVLTKGGEQCGFEATARRLRTVWLDTSRARYNGSDCAAICLERLGVPSRTALAKTESGDLDACREAKRRVEGLLRGKANPMVGESEAILRMYRAILDAALHPRLPVLVYGETGSGKEVLFDLLRALQDKERKFNIRDLSSLSDANTIRSTIFGHVEGAFTGADASRAGAVEASGGGTLVLDNLQVAPLQIFSALLRVLERKQEYEKLGDDMVMHAHCRIIAGFNVRPETLIEQGKLPEDWLMRFQIRIDIPPLRDRTGDIPLLVEAFVQDMISQGQPPVVTLGELSPPPEVVAKWQRLRWEGKEGNVRGLKNAVEAYVRKVRIDRAGEPVMEEAAASTKAKAGRPKGKRDISDGDLASLLQQVADDHAKWNKEKLFDQIDKRSGRHHMKRTQDALLKRIGRLDEDSPAEDAKQQRLRFSSLVRSLKGFDKL